MSDKLNEELQEYLMMSNPDAQYPTGFEKAIIGCVERFGMEPQFLLDRDVCIEILMEQGMSIEEADEYFEFNVIGSGFEHAPCFAVLFNSVERFPRINRPKTVEERLEAIESK